jgi:CBS domain-containing protein
MKIEEFLKYSRQQVVTCGPTDSLEAVAKLLHKHGIGAMPVCESGPGSRMIGIVSERDLVRAMATDARGLPSMRVRDLMTADVVTLSPEETMHAAQALMRAKGFRHLPIVQGQRLLGILSIRDTLASRLEESRIEIDTLRDFALTARCLPLDRGR